MIIKCDTGRNHVKHDRTLVSDSGLEHAVQLALVARERATDESRAQRDGHGTGIDGRKIVQYTALQFRSKVGSGRKLALGEAVYAVVLDDVNNRQVAAHQVNKLSNANGGRIAVAAHSESNQLMICQHGAGGDRRHAAVHSVEAVRAAHEICRALRGASDAAGLDDAFGLYSHFVHGIDDAFGNRVMATAGAKRGLAATIVENGETNTIDFRCGRRCAGRRHVICPP